jgi:hypothetical protein
MANTIHQYIVELLFALLFLNFIFGFFCSGTSFLSSSAGLEDQLTFLLSLLCDFKKNLHSMIFHCLSNECVTYLLPMIYILKLCLDHPHFCFMLLLMIFMPELMNPLRTDSTRTILVFSGQA